MLKKEKKQYVTSTSNAPKLVYEKKEAQSNKKAQFTIGDSVMVFPQKLKGIVFEPENKEGLVGVQIQGRKKLVNIKRVKLLVPAASLYPEDYDFSIIFDSVENRKAKHAMGRKKTELVATYENIEEASRSWQ